MSDYDLLVLTSYIDLRGAGSILDDIERAYYKRPMNQVPIRFINDDIKNFKEKLSRADSFLGHAEFAYS